MQRTPAAAIHAALQRLGSSKARLVAIPAATVSEAGSRMTQQCTAAPLCLVQRVAPPAAAPASRVEKDGQAFAVKVPGRQWGELPLNAQILQVEADKHVLLAPMKRGVVHVLHVDTVTEGNLRLPLLFMK